MGKSSDTCQYSPLKVMETAIMVDGGFYQKMAKRLFGKKSPKARATELERYCKKHIKKTGDRHLYRIFYYDCPPSDAVLWNPIGKKNVPLAKASSILGRTIFTRSYRTSANSHCAWESSSIPKTATRSSLIH